MADYIVRWVINLEADSPEEAAKLALEIQRDPTSLAQAFAVSPYKLPTAQKERVWHEIDVKDAEMGDPYLETGGMICPYCKCEDICAMEAPNMSGSTCHQKVECTSCGKRWKDEFTLTGWNPLDG